MSTADLARACAEAIQAQVGRADTRTSILDQIAYLVAGAITRGVEDERERQRPVIDALEGVSRLAAELLLPGGHPAIRTDLAAALERLAAVGRSVEEEQRV